MNRALIALLVSVGVALSTLGLVTPDSTTANSATTGSTTATTTPNSQVFTYLERSVQGIQAKLTWNATTVEQHAAWRQEFRKKLVELLGMPAESSPSFLDRLTGSLGGETVASTPEVRWDESEVLETDAFTRRKVYVRTETDYWAPAYYYVPKNVSGARPAIICFHGHSGILPYIREGSAAEKKKTRLHHLDYAPYFAGVGTKRAMTGPIAASDSLETPC
jgi:hypothetical protein